MLLPVWATPQPALGDYNNHLLQANIVLHHDDPAYGYAAGYEVVPRWYLHTTSLSTLLLVGLGTVMPITLAGRFVLTIYLVLFMVALGLLLGRTQNRWPLLLAGPVLAYNLTFTTGFINFAYGLVMGMFALVFLLRWRESRRPRDLWLVGGLMLLASLAHVLAWILWLFALAAMTSVDRLFLRRRTALYAALTAGALLLGLTRPALAVAALTVAPGLWLLGWVLRRARLPAWVLVLGGVVVAGAAYRLRPVVRLPDPWQQLLLPDAIYNRFDKLVTPLRLLTLPHQFAPPDWGLTLLNLGLLVLGIGVAALLALHTWRGRGQVDPAWPRTVGLLLLAYMLLPTRTYDIVVVEPRVLIVVGVLAVAAVPPLGFQTQMRRTVMAGLVGLVIVSAGTLGYAAYRHGQQVTQWRAQLATLAPTQNLLVFYDSDQNARNYANWLRFFTTVHDGRHLLNLYGIEHGGMVSVLFNNGPVRLRPEAPLPGYWTGFDYAGFVVAECASLRATYGAAVAIVPVPSDLITALDACFGPRRSAAPLMLWRHEAD